MKISITLAVLTGTFETDLARADKATQKRMRAIKKEMQDAGKVIGTTFAAIAGATTLLIRNAINNADKLDEMAQRTGIAVETLSRLQLGAKLGAVELETLQKSVGRLAVRQREYAEGNKDAVALFDALGIAAKNADGSLRNTDAVLKDLSRVFSVLPDGADKTALAIEVFGRAGQELIPFLNLGPQKLEELDRKADALGITISGNTAKAAGEFNDQLDFLILGAQGLATQVAAELLPDMLELTKAFQENATAGGEASEAAVNIANGIRGVVFVADKGYQFIKLLTLGVVGFTASVAEFLATYTPMGRLATTGDQRQALGDIAAVSLAGAEEARQDILGGGDSVDPMSGSRQGRAAATRDSSTEAMREAEASTAAMEAIKKLREQRAGEADAAKASAAARKAAADAAREQAKREKELQEIQERGAKAFEEVTEATRANAAFLAGPAAQAAKDYADELIALVGQEQKLRDANMLSADSEAALLLARQQAQEKYQRSLDEIEEKRTQQARQLLEDIEEETRLMGLSNVEREKAIALRYANVDAASEEGKAITAAIDALEESRRVAEGLDVVRGATQGLFSDLMSGAKSAKEAFMDFVDGILEGIAQIVARNLTESLLGSFGSTGGGSSGGGLVDLFAGLFGGARASGGPVNPNQAFLVGEQGPELFIPPVAGTIATNSQTRKMMGGTSVQQNITVVGAVDRRAADRLRIDAARNQQKAMARSY